MKFDSTINLGNIITFIVLVLGIVKIYLGVTGRLDRLETRMEPLWRWFTAQMISRTQHEEQPMSWVRRAHDEPERE